MHGRLPLHFRGPSAAQNARCAGRGLVITLTFALCAAPAGAATLVVLNKADSTASLVDLATGKVVRTLRTGKGPHEVAVSPSGTRALATNYGTREEAGSSLTLIDVGWARTRTIDLGGHKRPHGVRWLDEKRALVTAEGSQALLIVDIWSEAVEAIPTEQLVSHMVAVTPDQRRAFVANIESSTMTAIDLRQKKVVLHVPTGKGAEGIDVTPNGDHVWVTNREADTVSVLDTATLEVVASIACPGFPIRVKITPDGTRALVSNARSNDVAVFDARTFMELRRVKTGLESGTVQGRLLGFDGGVPIGICIAPDGKRAWVAHANADAIAVLDLTSWKPVGTLQAGREPDGIAYSPVRVAP
jgi:YVTN family beta-propeller protein